MGIKLTELKNRILILTGHLQYVNLDWYQSLYKEED